MIPGLPDGLELTGSHPLSGGDVARVWRGTLRDGTAVVVKEGSTPAELEAEGLESLREAGAACPRVLAVSDNVLVLEHVSGPGDPSELGAMLATVHRTTADTFGWHRDNVIGPLPQANPPHRDWPTFLAQARLEPHLAALPEAPRDRIRAAISEGRLAAALDHGPPASLVHGDLWAGNVVGGRWLIDPAVHHADREVDLAMLDLFGGIPPEVRSGYDRVWPLSEGWRRRRDVLQLVPLAIHVRLFGRAYLAGIEDRLTRLGW